MSVVSPPVAWPADKTGESGEIVLSLHDATLSHRLDALFDRQFRKPRKPTFRVKVNHALKRLMDVVVAGVGLLVLWPVLLIAGLASWCDTGRPIFYTQIRRIRFGRRARIYKMRTLIVGADRNLNALVNIKQNGLFLNIQKEASSYTRVGRYLERLWIVELPQLWNVLRGEMSLVGNRPIPDYVVGVLGPTPKVAERFASPQGMTGYTQIIGRDEVTDEERIDLEYHYSRIFEEGDVFIEDLRIIWLTVLAYLGIGRRPTVQDFLRSQIERVSQAAAQPDAFSRDGLLQKSVSALAEPEIPEDALACPTCYVVSDRCDPSRCHQECVSSCEPDAIRVENGRAILLDHCTACSSCVPACPLKAIDKAPLHRCEGGYRCDGCNTEYPLQDGILDLLPRRETIKASPYFEFYDKEYVNDHPEVHLEDTDWKLRELRPLVAHTGHYRNLVDIGCGAGVLGWRLAASLDIDQRTPCDWSTGILSVARGHDPARVYLRTDSAYLPMRNGAYDLALLIDVLEHQDQPDQVLRELARISRRLLVRTPLEDCWYEGLRRRRKDLFRDSSGHVVYFNPASIRERLGRQGWRVVRQSVKRIAWCHWKRVIFGTHPLKAKLTATTRFLLGCLLPLPLYHRLFVTNYNALCESEFHHDHHGGSGQILNPPSGKSQSPKETKHNVRR